MVQFTRVLGHPFHFSFDEDVTSASLRLMSAPKHLPLAPALVFFAVSSIPPFLEHWKPAPARGVDAVSNISPLWPLLFNVDLVQFLCSCSCYFWSFVFLHFDLHQLLRFSLGVEQLPWLAVRSCYVFSFSFVVFLSVFALPVRTCSEFS